MTATTEQPQTILVTGGCGYIGSHTIVVLLQQGYNVVVVDNLANSSTESLNRVQKIVGLSDEERQCRLSFFECDITDKDALRQVFEASPTFASCIHFAGMKAVGESKRIPLKYYDVNLGGTLTLLRLLDEYQCHNLVFSSSCTVYGAAEKMPITEDTTVGNVNCAYGRSKYMVEEVLQDFYDAKVLTQENTWSISILRYFNPVGAHPSGEIGESPRGIPNCLLPYVTQVAVGKRDCLTVFGGDFPTPDGTGVRDYLHVMDLAEGHLAAINYLSKKGTGTYTFNLGTGTGYSVLDMVHAMEKACGHAIKYKVGDRRPGDVATCYADPTFAKQELGWVAKLGITEMCRDAWAWQEKNPNGFEDVEVAAKAPESSPAQKKAKMEPRTESVSPKTVMTA